MKWIRVNKNERATKLLMDTHHRTSFRRFFVYTQYNQAIRFSFKLRNKLNGSGKKLSTSITNKVS